MPIEQALLDMMLDTITLELANEEKDKYGDFTYQPPIEVQCQITHSNKLALTLQGQETTSTFQAILGDPTIPVTVDTRITTPDGSHPAIIQVLSAKDDTGLYYLEIRA